MDTHRIILISAFVYAVYLTQTLATEPEQNEDISDAVSALSQIGHQQNDDDSAKSTQTRKNGQSTNQQTQAEEEKIVIEADPPAADGAAESNGSFKANVVWTALLVGSAIAITCL